MLASNKAQFWPGDVLLMGTAGKCILQLNSKAHFSMFVEFCLNSTFGITEVSKIGK